MQNKVAIREFKAHCLEILKKLENSNNSIIITKRNKPIATLFPFSKNKSSICGMLKNKAEIKGDIMTSINETWKE